MPIDPSSPYHSLVGPYQPASTSWNPEVIQEVRPPNRLAHNAASLLTMGAGVLLAASQLSKFYSTHAAVEASLLRGGVLRHTRLPGALEAVATSGETMQWWRSLYPGAAAAIVAGWVAMLAADPPRERAIVLLKGGLLLATGATLWVGGRLVSYAERRGALLSLLLADELRARRDQNDSITEQLANADEVRPRACHHHPRCLRTVHTPRGNRLHGRSTVTSTCVRMRRRATLGAPRPL